MVFVIIGVLLLLAGAGALGSLWYVCGRRQVPDFWDEGVLLRRGLGRRRGEVLGGKEWFESVRREPIRTESDDELELYGELIPQKPARGTVLLFHDCRSSWKLDFAAAARFYYEQGFQVLLVDQRAHGQSKGRYTTYGVWERFDVRAWTNYLELRYTAEHPIILAGLGMGAAAVLMASPLELYGDVRGIIAEGAYLSPYRYLENIMEEKVSLLAWPFLGLVNLAAQMFAGFGLKEQSAEDAVRETEYPLLLIHGTRDRVMPGTASQRIFEVCRSEKRLLLVEGADHGECFQAERKKFRAAVRTFLDAHVPVI